MRGREHPVDKAHRLYREAEAREREKDEQWKLADWEEELLFPAAWYIKHGSLFVGPYPNRRRAQRLSSNGGVPVCVTETMVIVLRNAGLYSFKEPTP